MQLSIAPFLSCIIISKLSLEDVDNPNGVETKSTLKRDYQQPLHCRIRISNRYHFLLPLRVTNLKPLIQLASSSIKENRQLPGGWYSLVPTGTTDEAHKTHRNGVSELRPLEQFPFFARTLPLHFRATRFELSSITCRQGNHLYQYLCSWNGAVTRSGKCTQDLN